MRLSLLSFARRYAGPAVIGALMGLVSVLPAVAQNTPPRDMAGSKDHPLVKRFAGAEIIGYDTKRFDSYTLQTGTFVAANADTKQYEFAQSLPLEGAVTRIWYESTPETSAVELIRNYQTELAAQGFTVLYDSTKDPARKPFKNYLVRFENLKIGNFRQEFVFKYANPETVRFTSLKLSRPQGDVYVALTTVDWLKADGTYHANRATYASVEVIEVGAITRQMVTVSASDMSKAMTATGRVALYGILFDTGRAEVKPESKSALDEIGKLLKSEPALKLRIVGHTDNQGGLDANIALSKRRAEAVSAALVSQYGIASARLSAYGVADLAPVASNAAEEGRAKNRRVELVPQ